MDIYIYDDIGPDWAGMVSAQYVQDQLAKASGGHVTVRLNSLGGDVHQAMAIYNALQRHAGGVTIEIDGVAASAASYIAMAGGKIRIAENAMLMIHEPWTVAFGNASELRKTADVLDKHGDGIASVYAARSKADKEQVVAAMAAETWYSAKEAVEAGLADEIGQPLKVSAAIKPGRFNNTPRSLLVAKLDREQRSRLSIAETRIQIAQKRLTESAR